MTANLKWHRVSAGHYEAKGRVSHYVVVAVDSRDVVLNRGERSRWLLYVDNVVTDTESTKAALQECASTYECVGK